MRFSTLPNEPGLALWLLVDDHLHADAARLLLRLGVGEGHFHVVLMLPQAYLQICNFVKLSKCYFFLFIALEGYELTNSCCLRCSW